MMPLPVTPQPIFHLDKDGKIRDDVAVKTKESGYQPDGEYFPSMIPVRCFGCKSVGILEFVNGFNIKDGDSLMAGKPVKAVCFRCQSEQEMIPLTVTDKDAADLPHLYKIRQALEYAAKRGWKVGPSSVILPVEKLKQKERLSNNDPA